MQINSNISGMQNNNCLRLQNLDFNTRIERLSSGLRINKGADDPSGLAISKGMTAQIRGTNVAIQNCQDGINLIQTMDAGLNEIQDILLRMRELSVRAANEATLTVADRARMQAEVVGLRDEIDQIVGRTKFNEKDVFAPVEASWGLLFVHMGAGFPDIYYSKDGGTSLKQLTTNARYDWLAGFSPDCSKIAFYTDRDLNGEIYLMDPDGTNKMNITNNPSGDTWPQWSPDGSKIAFQTNRDGNDEIYVIDSDGSNPINISNNLGSDTMPVWSPDGSKIAFLSRRDGNAEIYVMNSDGSNQINITNHATNFESDPMWSPDSNKMIFTSQRSGNYEVYSVNSDGTNLTNISNNPSMDAGHMWSPDGKSIIFSTTRDGNTEIYKMNDDGSNQCNITNNSSEERQAFYSPDGEYIAFISNRNGNNRVFLMKADGSEQTLVSNPGSLNSDVFSNYSMWKAEPPSDIFSTAEQIQVSAENGEEYRLDLIKPQISAAGLGLSTINVSSSSSALTAINSVDGAISSVSDARALAGIQHKRLHHIVNDLTSTAINTSAARSRIEDADMAVEATELAKRQILTKSTSAMSAQANSEQQAVLELIGQTI